jgi:hypothetical protein
MTYTAGSLIEATDYNGFVANNAGANLNDIWSTGASDKGYGQTALTTVSAAGTVTAAQWAGLVNNISTMASQQGTSITSRTAPTAGNTIAILAALNTDLTNLTSNRNNAAASGTEVVSWSGSSAKTSATGSGTSAWTITFTHTIAFSSANAARYFFNAGGRIRWRVGKSSTGTLADPEWNDLASTLCGAIFITGAAASKNIASTAYTGTTKVGGTGTPNTLSTATGFYALSTSDTLIYRQYADTSPYTGQYIAVNAKTAGSGTQLVLTTTWVDPGGSGAGATDDISGGTDTASPFSSFGTAPATVVTYFPPSSTYLSNTWGTPTITASVA